MARSPENVTAQLASTTLTTIYTVPASTATTAAVLTFTNTTTTAIVISIYKGNGTDFLAKKITLPAGIGRDIEYNCSAMRNMNTTETVKIQADSTSAFNYSLSYSEIA